MTINIELPGPAAHRVIWRDGTGEPSNWTQYHDDSDPLPESWDDEVPDIVTPLYTADQVRAIVAADRAERAAPAQDIDSIFSTLRYVLGTPAAKATPQEHYGAILDTIASWPLVGADATKSAAALRARKVAASIPTTGQGGLS